MLTPSRRWLGGVVLMMGLLSWTSRGETAEWSAEPSLTVRGEYNSNLLLVSGSREDTWGHWVSPVTKVAGSSENFEVSSRLAADFVQYYGGTDRALTNLYFPLAVRYKSQRETFSFDGGFTRDNTLMGELRQTGVVLSFTQRNLWSLAPVWTHALTERVSLQAGYQYSDAKYENGARLGLVDYTVHGASGGALYSLTELDQVKFIGSYTNFHAPQGGDLRSEIYNGTLSVTRNFSESITGTVAGGLSYVRSTTSSGFTRLSDGQTVWVGSASVRKQWEDTALQFDASREIFPSGFGLLLRTDRVGVTLYKDFTEQWTASLGTNVLFASAITSAALPISFPTNRYINVSPAITWKFSQWWNLTFTYTYAQRDVEAVNDMSFANVAGVMLTYFPPKLTVGR